MHYACPRGVARPARSPCVGTVLTEPAGGFGVYRAPQPLALPPPCQQLVALAALKRRTVHRSWICSTLWPYAPPAKAVASLRSAVATASSRRRPPACRRHPFRGLGAGRFGGLARCGRADHAAARRFGAGRRRSSSGRRSASPTAGLRAPPRLGRSLACARALPLPRDADGRARGAHPGFRSRRARVRTPAGLLRSLHKRSDGLAVKGSPENR